MAKAGPRKALLAPCITTPGREIAGSRGGKWTLEISDVESGCMSWHECERGARHFRSATTNCKTAQRNAAQRRAAPHNYARRGRRL